MMNIGGVSGAAGSAEALRNAPIGVSASVKVMNLAENVMEESMGQLLDTLDSMVTGLGQGLDEKV